MQIKFHYGIEAHDYYGNQNTCLFYNSLLSFLIESSNFNFGKGEVMHNEETI